MTWACAQARLAEDGRGGVEAGGWPAEDGRGGGQADDGAGGGQAEGRRAGGGRTAAAESKPVGGRRRESRDM